MQVRRQCEIRRVTIQDDAVTEVVTDAGPIRCQFFVNAAGFVCFTLLFSRPLDYQLALGYIFPQKFKKFINYHQVFGKGIGMCLKFEFSPNV